MKQLDTRDTLKTWRNRYNQAVSEGILAAFSNDEAFNSGLSFFVRASYYNRGTTPVLIPDTVVSLTDNTTNIVYLDTTPNSEQVVSVDEANFPSDNSVQLYRVVTSSGQIDTVEDIRSWMFIEPKHNSMVSNFEVFDAHPRYELVNAIGNVTSPTVDIPFKSPNDAKSLNGDFEYLCHTPSTYISPLGDLTKTEYFYGTLAWYDVDARSIYDPSKSFPDLSGYVIYLTDDVNEAYRWVDVNDSTKVVWTKPIAFEPTSYKISKPRFERKGLLVEGYSNNRLLYSESLDNGDWIKYWCTIAADETNAPDGSVTADKIVESSDFENHYLSQGITITDGEPLTVSVFVKPAGRSWFRMRTSLLSNPSARTWFDLSNGVVGKREHNKASITPLKNGWYRCSVTELDTVGDTNVQCQFFPQTADNETQYQGDGASGVYLWGAQAEELARPTSYIPTTSANAGRDKPQCRVKFDNNHPSLKTGQFSVVVSASTYNELGDSDRIILSAGYGEIGTDKYSLIRLNQGENVVSYYRSAVSNKFAPVGSYEDMNRFGVTVDGQDTVILYTNGRRTVSDVKPLSAQGNNPEWVSIGMSFNEGLPLYGHISNLKIYDKVLNDHEMRIA